MTKTASFTHTGAQYSTSRIIGHIKGSEDGPLVIFIGAIHGNEPSGVIALQQLFEELDGVSIQGEILAVVGNMEALDNGRRFVEQDLNRMWTARAIDALQSKSADEEEMGVEDREQKELLRLFAEYRRENRPTYFIDLHTTSSESMPFMSISRTLENINFASSLHVPKVVGIERFIQGPLLDYMSAQGHVAMAFEAGQHEGARSVRYQFLFICEVLHQLGIYSSSETINKTGNVKLQGTFELRYRHDITEVDDFRMRSGYTNFDEVMKGEILASESGKEIEAPSDGRIFMPLYQSEGNDGFFIISEG